MNKRVKKSENGQALVLLAILMIGLLAMLALILDGGNLMTKRRSAQNAADAGALAGARTLCIPDDPTVSDYQRELDAENEADYYAINLNEADWADADASLPKKLVTVTTRITSDTFFLHILGRPELTAQASAAAGCYTPNSAKVLPIAWVCKRPTITGTVSTVTPSNDQCVYDIITVQEAEYNTNYPDANPSADGIQIHPELYVLMNSNAQPDDLTAYCSEEVDGGQLICDLDGDGDLELVAHGDRSWLDLDGEGGGASELRDWINEGYFDADIYSHTWIGGESGTETSVFQAAADHIGEVVAVPIFDIICDQEPDMTQSDTYCWPDGIADHPLSVEKLVVSAGGNYYYHIIAFAAFYIACVDSPGVAASCPGHDSAVDLGVFADNTKTIEGYFVSGSLPNLSGIPVNGGIDIGVYDIYLIK